MCAIKEASGEGYPLLGAEPFEPAMKTGRELIHHLGMFAPKVRHLAGILIQVR